MAKPLFHGSPRKIKGTLQPRREHGDPDVEAAVFASPSPTFATAYAGRKTWGDRDLEQSTRGGKNARMILREMRPGALKDIYGGRGHLYEVPPDSFKRVPTRNRTANELVSSQPVTPLRAKTFPNTLEALRKMPDVELHEYDPQAPENRAAVKRQVKRMRDMDDGGAGYLKWRLKPAPPEIKQMFKEEMAKTARGVDVDDYFSSDPGKLMPRLKQIHKTSDATEVGIEDLDALRDSPGGEHGRQPTEKESSFEYAATGPNAGEALREPPLMRLPKPPGRLKKLGAGMVPGAQESYYLAQQGAQDDYESVGLPELLAMAGQDVAQGAHMARTSKRLVERVNQRLDRRARQAQQQPQQQQMLPVATRAHILKSLLQKLGSIAPNQMRKGTPVTDDFKTFKKRLKPGDIVFTKGLKIRTEDTNMALADALTPIVGVYDRATKAKHPGWVHGAMYLGKGRVGHLSNERLGAGNRLVSGKPTIGTAPVDMFNRGKNFDVLAVRPRQDPRRAVAEMKRVTSKGTTISTLRFTKNLVRAGVLRKGGKDVTDAVCTGVLGHALNKSMPVKQPLSVRPKDILEDKRVGHLIGYSPKTKTAAADLEWLEKFAEAVQPKGIKFVYLDTGGGHRAQANALVEAAQKKGIPAESVNWREHFAKGQHAKRYERAYTKMLHREGSQLSVALPAAKFSYLGTDKDKLQKWVGKNKDQAVVVAMEHLRKEFDGIDHPVHILHSDPVKWPFAHKGGNDPNRIDIGTPNVLRELGKKKGIAIPNVPVAQSTLRPKKRGRLMERGKFNVTVSAGSLGPEVVPIAEQVLKSGLPENARVHAVSGKNPRALRQLQRLAKKDPRLVPHGYAPLANMMREADLNVIRTHGTTLAESVAAGKPAVYYGPDVGFLRDGQGDLTKRTARWAGKRLGQPSAIGMESVTGAVDKAVGSMPRLRRRARHEKKRMGDPAAAAVTSIMKPRPGYVEKQASAVGRVAKGATRTLTGPLVSTGNAVRELVTNRAGSRPEALGSLLARGVRGGAIGAGGYGLYRLGKGKGEKGKEKKASGKLRNFYNAAYVAATEAAHNPAAHAAAKGLASGAMKGNPVRAAGGVAEGLAKSEAAGKLLKAVASKGKGALKAVQEAVYPSPGKLVYASVKEAYKLQGHTEVQGLPIAIENRKGSVRKGKDADGNEWRTKMQHPYGYLKGTKGADGEEVDCYVGPKKDAKDAFVVHQKDKDTGKYDEDKVMLGFPSKRAAKEAFLAHYDSPKFLGPVAKVSMERLRELVASKGQLTKISQASWAALLAEVQVLEKSAAGALGQKQLAQRFGRLTRALEEQGTPIDTHKRILIPKRVLGEGDLKRLGFEGSATGVPEAGQSRFTSFRSPTDRHHLHEHGDAWTMHRDEHAPPTIREGTSPVDRAGQAVDIAKALPHIVMEGVPASYEYAKGRLKGAPGIRERIEKSPQAGLLRRRFRRWAPSEGVDKAASAPLPATAPQRPQKLTTWQRIRKAGPGVGGLLGAGVGAVMGAKRGKLLKGTLAGLGTGATLGWVPDMAASAREGIRGRR